MSIGQETKVSHDAPKTILQLVKWTPCFTSCMQTNPSHIFSWQPAPSKKSERYSSNSLQFIKSAIRSKVFKRIHFEQGQARWWCHLTGPRPYAKRRVQGGRKIKVLLRDLPLTPKQRHRLLDYTKSFLSLWIRALQCSIDVSIVMGGFRFVRIP